MFDFIVLADKVKSLFNITYDHEIAFIWIENHVNVMKPLQNV